MLFKQKVAVYGVKNYAPLAQLDRAFGYGPKGQEFESLTARQIACFITKQAFLFAFWSCRGVDAKYGKLMLKTFLKQKARVFFRAFFSQIK